MKYQSLYQQFKWKQFQQKQVQQIQLAKIHNMCNQPKININSTSILLKRTIQILDQFPDQQMINLQSSIPILQAVSILQVLKSVAEAKEKLSETNDLGAMQSRLRCQAEFLYHLWNLIDQEQIECKELKELIELLQAKKKNQLRFVLTQMYPDEERVESVIRSWIVLTANQQYYKHISKPSATKSHQSNKQNSNQSTSQFQQSFHFTKNQKLNQLNRSGELGSPIYQKTKSATKSGRKVPLNNTQYPINQICGQNDRYQTNQFGYTCQLSHDQEKQLIDRLYKNDIYQQRQQQRRERQQQKQQEQLKKCTFRPSLLTRGKSANHFKSQSQIRGYDKAINRLKAGTQKNKLTKQLRQHKPIGQNYQKIKQKGLNPPKFLQRKKKEQQKVLFIISFDLGRYKTNVKIRENDTEDSVAERICKIYSLKKEFYEQIREIVRNQLDAYYQELQQGRYEGQENF